MADFYLKRNDTSPSLEYTLHPPVNLNGASVNFHMMDRTGAVVVDKPAVVVNDAQGIVRYDWDVLDTAEVGTFNAEFEVTFTDGAVETYPNSKNISIQIAADIV